MPTITVQSDAFDVRIDPEDLVLQQPGILTVRFPVCIISYPSSGLTNLTLLPEGLEDGDNMGVLRVVKTNQFQNFATQDANINQDTSAFDVNNKLTIKEEFVNPGISTFKPCNLDRNNDGIVTKSDLDRIYELIPFVNSDYDINNDGIVDIDDRLLAQEYIGTFCQSVIDDDGPDLIPASTFRFSAKDFLEQDDPVEGDGLQEGWVLGLAEDYKKYEHNEETFGAMNTMRIRVSETSSGIFRDYIQYCFDNGYIDNIEDYYDPSLPVGSPFIDTETFDEPVFDFNSFRQYYRTNAYSVNAYSPVVRYEHKYELFTRPIGRDFSVSFWWYWDSSLVPEGYTWQDVYANGYGGGGSSSDPTTDNFATLPAWRGTARYISENFYYGDDTVPPPESYTGNFNSGRTTSMHLWSISGLYQGYPRNELFDLDSYIEAQGLSYHDEFYPDRIENRCMMRYDHQYSRLWFTGAVAGANTDTTNIDFSQLGSIAIDRDIFWEQDKWHNIVVTKEEGERAKAYLDGEEVGTFFPASPIGYYSGLRAGPEVNSQGEPTFRYPQDTVSRSRNYTEDVYFGGPAVYVSNLNRTYGHWRPSTEAYWSTSGTGQGNHYGQGSGSFIGKTNAFKVWDQALTAEDATKVYNQFVASNKDAPT